MLGRVIRLITREYTVESGGKLYKSKAMGRLRNNNQKAIVGDMVEIIVSSETEQTGHITKVLKRKNRLLRPEISNLNKLVCCISLKDPEPNLMTLDRVLLDAQSLNIDIAILINKIDLGEKKDIAKIKSRYINCPYEFIETSIKLNTSKEKILSHLVDGINVFAGPSGVGKSSLINIICPDASVETGEISRKRKTGKHTTRHSELIKTYKQNALICDTPGFTNMQNSLEIDEKNLETLMPDIFRFSKECAFSDCLHDKEPNCSVKDALDRKEISKERYNSYIEFLEELRDKRRNKKW